jgi:hypothetical protein
MLAVVIWLSMKKKKNRAAVSLAALRKEKLSPERRSEIAKIAAKARWAKK